MSCQNAVQLSKTLELHILCPLKQKIIIVNRKLAAAADGTILPAPSGPVDLEVREVWQPWLKRRCNFVLRYIVPNRANIMELMENQGRFRAEVRF